MKGSGSSRCSSNLSRNSLFPSIGSILKGCLERDEICRAAPEGEGRNHPSRMGVSMAMGVPKNGWMVFVMENPIQKWMMTEGTPILGKLQMDQPPPIPG